MKKLSSVAAFALVLMAALTISSCVTTTTIEKQFAKKGYTMGSYGWNEMCGVCPFLSQFPANDATAMGYIAANEVYTFAYQCDAATMDNYAAKLTAAGYKAVAQGVYAKATADKKSQYKVKITSSTINKKSYYFVGYSMPALN